MAVSRTVAPASTGRGWPRAAGLLGVVFAASVVEPFVLPWVLVGVPLAMLLAARGLQRYGIPSAALLTVLLVLPGPRDGLWFAERAWSILIGGGFVALTMLVPSWPLSSRALGAVAGAMAMVAGVLAMRAGAWAKLDATVSGGVTEYFDRVLDAVSAAGGPEAVTPAMVAMVQQAAAAQSAIFPALTGIASMAALGVAWWMHTRLAGEGDQGIGPLREFRFNDHLVWLLVAGLLLVVAQWGDAFARLGSNTVVFMGALYVLRGTAVLVFLTGGISFLGYALLALVLLLAAPVIVGVAGVIGVGDTWLDLRSRTGERPA